MAESAMQGYDIIGDVHGCADELEALLAQLGYESTGGAGEYRHPNRQAVF
ncbi:MAG: metallophosphatase, partial [Mycobacterium sp.]